MKLKIAIVVFSSAAVVSCQATRTAQLDLQETNPTASAVTSSEPSYAPTTSLETTAPTIGIVFQARSEGGIMKLDIGSRELSINLDPLNEIDDAGVIVTIIDLEDQYLVEIFDPQERYLPAVRFFEKTGEIQQDLDIHLPPAILGSVIFNDGAVQLENLELEKIISIPINELRDTVPWLRESYAATVLFPRYWDSSQFDNVDVYRIRNAQALYVVLPSDTLVAMVGKLAAPAKVIQDPAPFTLIPIALLWLYREEVLDYIVGFIEEPLGETGLTMVVPDDVILDNTQAIEAYMSKLDAERAQEKEALRARLEAYNMDQEGSYTTYGIALAPTGGPSSEYRTYKGITTYTPKFESFSCKPCTGISVSAVLNVYPDGGLSGILNLGSPPRQVKSFLLRGTTDAITGELRGANDWCNEEWKMTVEAVINASGDLIGSIEDAHTNPGTCEANKEDGTFAFTLTLVSSP